MNRAEAPDYTLNETIEQLEGWRRGGAMYPVEVANSAVYWLERAPGCVAREYDRVSLRDMLDALRSWLSDDMRYMPDSTALGALGWLRHVKAARSAELCGTCDMSLREHSENNNPGHTFVPSGRHDSKAVPCRLQRQRKKHGIVP